VLRVAVSLTTTNSRRDARTTSHIVATIVPLIVKLFRVQTMAAMSLSTSQKLGCSRVSVARKPMGSRKASAFVPRASAAAGEVPDMGKRNVMNLLLVGAIGLPATSLIGGYAYFFVPPR
jgi:hypothetical protein